MLRFPATCQGLLGDEFFQVANGDSTVVVVQRAGPFTEAILRADAATDFRKGIGTMGQRRRLFDAIFDDELQPVRDVVVHRAFPLAIGVATV